MNRHGTFFLVATSAVIFSGFYGAVPTVAAEPNTVQNKPAVQGLPKAIQDLTLVGSTVHNLSGQKLGEIQYVLLAPSTGQAKFVILDAEGPGSAHMTLVVPFQALRVSFNHAEKRQVVEMNIQSDQLASAPQIRNNQWQVLQNQQFRDQVRSFYHVSKTYTVARPIVNPSVPSTASPVIAYPAPAEWGNGRPERLLRRMRRL